MRQTHSQITFLIDINLGKTEPNPVNSYQKTHA
jgi:hypothetical protein